MRRIAIIVSLITSLMVNGYSTVYAQSIDFDSLADAIYQAEGARQGELYGIHSVHYSSEAKAREICLRTLQHKHAQWRACNSKFETYLPYLSRHYCPKHSARWLRNVRWFYSKELKQKEVAV